MFFNLLLSLFLGALLADSLSSWRLGPHWVERGGWHTNLAFSSSEATWLERYYAAKHALFVLPKEEALYFFREKDEQGLPINEKLQLQD